MPRPTARRPRRTSRDLRGGPWALAGGLLFALLAAWSLGMPLMSSPDEQSHVIRAAAVARGEWSGTLGPSPVDATRPAAATEVELPADLAATRFLPACYAFNADLTADCSYDLDRKCVV